MMTENGDRHTRRKRDSDGCGDVGGDVGCSPEKRSKLGSIQSHDEEVLRECLTESGDSAQTLTYSLEASYDIDGADRRNGEIEDVALGGEGSVTIKATPTQLNKIASVQSDAEKVAELLGIKQVDAVYNKILAKQAVPDRVTVITNDILENGIEEVREESESIEQTKALLPDVDKVLMLLRVKQPQVQYDPNRIYELLEAEIATRERVKTVVNILLGGDNGSDLGDSLMQDLKTVTNSFPKVDAKRAFELLEKYKGVENRAQQVVDVLNRMENEVGDEVPGQDDVDPLLRDTCLVYKMFPGLNKQEIYAYLGAHHDNPNRVQIVTEEFLRMQGSGQTDVKSFRPPDQTDSSISGVTDSPVDPTRLDVDRLRAIFPDCDPNYLFEKLEEMPGNENRCDMVSEALFKDRNYPKLKDRMDQTKKATKKQLLNNDFVCEEFLKTYPDPKSSFYNEDSAVTESYKEHAFIALRNTYPMLRAGYIKNKLEQFKFHFLPTCRALEKPASNYSSPAASTKSRYRRTQRDLEPMPDDPDDYFYQELQFARREVEILAYIKLKEEERKRRLDNAKSKGLLHECQCCYDDEVLFEDMAACPEGHLFCKECIKRSSDEVVGQGKCAFPCLMGDDCGAQFTLSTLQTVLPAKMLTIILNKVQEEEIREANIEDLVTCPYCSFAAIMPDAEDKVLKCQNPGCLKESCRICREPNHVPLRCEEVEKQGETNMRTFIESRMSEAMLRTCWRCKKRFFKTEGCNMMRCTCGAGMCYVCQEPINDYSHFNDGRCAHDIDVKELHHREMMKAGQEARRKYLAEHPEVAEGARQFTPGTVLQGEGDLYTMGGEDQDHDEYEEEYSDEDEDGEWVAEEERHLQQALFLCRSNAK